VPYACRMTAPVYFYRGYAVHGMTSVPAYPASHGCVRITVPSMDRMWSSLRVGMPVGIYES
jgi:lipoprotein-anchoring transpeptidase ErfK/SrfK